MDKRVKGTVVHNHLFKESHALETTLTVPFRKIKVLVMLLSRCKICLPYACSETHWLEQNFSDLLLVLTQILNSCNVHLVRKRELNQIQNFWTARHGSTTL